MKQNKNQKNREKRQSSHPSGAQTQPFPNIRHLLQKFFCVLPTRKKTLYCILTEYRFLFWFVSFSFSFIWCNSKTRTFDFRKSNFWLRFLFFSAGRLTLSANREAEKSGLERYKRIWALLPRSLQSVPGILMRRSERSRPDWHRVWS